MPDLVDPPTPTRPPTPRHARRRRPFSTRLDAPLWVLLVEVFIGLGWLRAAVEKIVDPTWWSGDVVADFLAEHEGATLPWYSPVVDLVVRPGMGLVLVSVVLVQLGISAALLTGVRRELALGAGLFLNVNFIAIGAVTPSAFYVVAQVAVLLWVLESRLRVDPARRVAAVGAVSGLILAIASLPFVATLDPASVIDDPAVMLTTLGLLVAATCVLALSRPAPQESSARYVYS